MIVLVKICRCSYCSNKAEYYFYKTGLFGNIRFRTMCNKCRLDFFSYLKEMDKEKIKKVIGK